MTLRGNTGLAALLTGDTDAARDAFREQLMVADLKSARENDNVVAYLVPYGVGYTLGLAYLDWLVAQLRGRGIEVKIDTRRADNGIALFLEDVTPEGDRA
jgi:hypothetical protein